MEDNKKLWYCYWSMLQKENQGITLLEAPSQRLLKTDALYRMTDVDFLKRFRLNFLNCLSLLWLLNLFDFRFTRFACHPQNAFIGIALFFLGTGTAAKATAATTIPCGTRAFNAIL